MAALGQLVVSFAAETARFERDIGKAARIAEKRAKAMQANFLKASKAIAGLGAAAGLAAGGLVKLTQSVAANADGIAKAAKAAGVGGEALQELRFAAEQSGVQSRQLDEGLRRLTRRIGLAATGTGPAVDMFHRLGINVKDAGGQVKGTETIFNEAVVKIGGLSTAAEQAAAASALFGDDAGPKLALLLAKGADGVNALRQAIRADGGVISNDALVKAEELNDKFNEMETILSARLHQAILDNSAGMSGMVDALADLLPKLVEMVTSTASLLATLTDMERIWRLINKQTGEDNPLVQLGTSIARTEEKIKQLRLLLGTFAEYSPDYKRIAGEIKGLEASLKKLSEQYKAAGHLAAGGNDKFVKTGETADDATEPVTALGEGIAETNKNAKEAEAALKKLRQELERLNVDTTTAAGNFDEAKIKLLEKIRALELVAEGTEAAYQEIDEMNLSQQLGIKLTDEQRKELQPLIDKIVALKAAERAAREETEDKNDAIRRQIDLVRDLTGGLFNLANVVGGALGNAIGNLGNVVGSIGSLLTPGGFNFTNVTGAIGSVIDFIGDLFGGDKPPRVEIVNNLNQANVPGGINAQSPFTDQFGNPIRIAAQRVRDIDRAEAQNLVDGLAAFDNLIFPILNEAQRFRVGQALVPGGNTETRQRYLDGEITLDEMLMDRFETILGGIGGRTAGIVNATNFGNTDQGFAALQAAVGIEGILASFATFKDDVLGGPTSLEDAMTRQAASVRSLADNYDGSLQSLQALGGGLEAFQQTAAAVLRNIQAARDAVSLGIGQTIDQLLLSRETTAQGRFGFLKGRFDTLAADLSGQNTSAGVLDTVNQLRALAPQILAQADAMGLTGAARQSFIDEQIATLREVETLAQERLDQIEQDKLDEIKEIGAAVGDRLDAVADKEAATAKLNSSTAKTMAGAARSIARTFAQGIDVDVAPAKFAPNPTG